MKSKLKLQALIIAGLTLGGASTILASQGVAMVPTAQTVETQVTFPAFEGRDFDENYVNEEIFKSGEKTTAYFWSVDNEASIEGLKAFKGDDKVVTFCVDGNYSEENYEKAKAILKDLDLGTTNLLLGNGGDIRDFLADKDYPLTLELNK